MIFVFMGGKLLHSHNNYSNNCVLLLFVLYDWIEKSL